MESLTMPLEELKGNHNQFVQHYFCHSFATINKPKLDKGNKILMPISALDCLMALNIDYPMMFSIQNVYDNSGRTSHCGVLEFTAEEGSIFIPQWMMDNLKILEGDVVLLKNTSLPKGTYVKLQPHATDFINLPNPKALLESALKKYACLTTGDTIVIPREGKEFRIDILETKPASAISIIDTDCEVDFAAPLDYKEPEKQASTGGNSEPKVAVKVEEEQQEKDKPMFVAFTGSGRRLDEAPAVSNVVENSKKNGISEKASSRTSCGCEEPAGKMVFGSSTMSGIPLKKHDIEEEDVCKKEEGNKFQPFTGRKNVIGLGNL